MYSRALACTSFILSTLFYIIYSASNSVYAATLREDSPGKSPKNELFRLFSWLFRFFIVLLQRCVDSSVRQTY